MSHLPRYESDTLRAGATNLLYDLLGVLAAGTFVIGILATVAYLIIRRDWSAAQLLLGLWFFTFLLAIKDRETSFGEKALIALIPAFVFFWSSRMFYALATYVPKFVLANVSVMPARVIGTLVLFVLAVILFYFRYYARACYGVTEVLFAMNVGWQQLPKTTLRDWDFSQSLPLAPALLTGCVYVAVRGIDNIQQGYSSDKFLTAWLPLFLRMVRRCRLRKPSTAQS